MRIGLADFNRFNKDLEHLERMSSGDPGRIEFLVKNSPEMRQLVGRLYYWRIDFESERRRHRYVTGAPTWFVDRYEKV